MIIADITVISGFELPQSLDSTVRCFSVLLFINTVEALVSGLLRRVKMVSESGKTIIRVSSHYSFKAKMVANTGFPAYHTLGMQKYHKSFLLFFFF